MNISQHSNPEKRTLRDFTRMVLAFFGSLVVLAIYQQLRLYALGVLDGVLGKSLFLLILHHLGFAAVVALPFSYVFKALERKRPELGFKTVRILLLLLLIVEGVLIEFYVSNFEILGSGFIEIYSSRTTVAEFVLTLAILSPICFGAYYLFYRLSSSTYKIIGRMYPFTIILFSLFLATLYSDKKPVNENKTQHLIVHSSKHALDVNKYDGEEEYPLLNTYLSNTELSPYFEFKDEAPNIVFVILEGIGSDLAGKNAAYGGFMPYLDSLTSSSLYWPNHLSNTAEGHASLATILGSLPFGESGFNKAPNKVNRNTLLGILKKNGYFTSFYYGGNTALNQWDKFLFEDRIDYLLDVKGFGDSFTKQEKDAAGISLGYPDKELFRKWISDRANYHAPYLEVFFTQSTKRPFQIPDRERFVAQVEGIAEKMNWDRRTSRVFRKNKEIFASISYADEALAEFMAQYRKLAEYQNTIFVITGSHNLKDLPQLNPLSRYRVPLIIHSPLIKKNKEINSLVSHADIMPSLLGLLQSKYTMKIPEQVSFLGRGLINNPSAVQKKQIPLFRHSGVEDFISGNHFISDGYTYQLNSDLALTDPQSDAFADQVEKEFNQYKAINKYVLRQNKLIPAKQALFAQTAKEPNKQEMIWINSVFNGTDFDNAYQTARSLALDGDYERALLLSSYVLNRVPGHADTEILMGRIHAWKGNYVPAIEILEGAILKYPVYTDAYSALLDVYFWSGNNEKAIQLKKKIEQHQLESKELKTKLERAFKELKQNKEASDRAVDLPKLNDRKTVVVNQSH